ncbi:MAG: hypothetical protein WA666_12295 [Nitrospirota bacterium]
MSEGLRSSGTCNRDMGKEQGPRSGNREVDKKECNPRAGNLREGSNSNPVVSNAELDHNTRKEDLKEGRGAFSNAEGDRNTRKENLKEGRGAAREAATGSVKIVEALN